MFPSVFSAYLAVENINRRVRKGRGEEDEIETCIDISLCVLHVLSG